MAITNDTSREQSEGTTAQGVVLVQSIPMPEGSTAVQGPDFNSGIGISAILNDYYYKMGFQASTFGQALNVINEMVFFAVIILFLKVKSAELEIIGRAFD